MITEKDKELVYCVIPEDKDNFIPTLAQIYGTKSAWLTRGQCEKDNRYKQVIPYLCFYSINDDAFVGYERLSGDSRLTGMHSLGIGGHVNYSDYCADTVGQMLNRNMKRELNEENPPLYKDVSHLDFSNYLRGFIYDPNNEIGEVHVGLVYVLPLPTIKPEYLIKDDEHIFKSLNFEGVSTLQTQKKLENWSDIMFRKLFLSKSLTSDNVKGFFPISEGK